MGIIFVGIGGALGSLVRFLLGNIISKRYKFAFPMGTFLINISGALLLGVVSRLHMDKNIYLLFGDGFLGAYTTFSTFMYEGFNLFHDRKVLNATVYIIGSILIGLIWYVIGFEMAGLIK